MRAELGSTWVLMLVLVTWYERTSPHRPPTGPSSCRCMTTATSFNRHPTSCPRSTSTRCEADATSRLMPGSGEGLRRARKTDHSEGYRGPGDPRDDGPGTHQSATSPGPTATHRPDNGCESAIDRAILSATKVSAMPAGLLNVLTRDEIAALVSFLEAGDNLPPTLRHIPHLATP